MTSTSHSEVESWLLCQRKHFYGYGMNLERVTVSDSLNDGSNGHAVLEVYYKAIRAAGTDRKAQRQAHGSAFKAAHAFYRELVLAGKWKKNPKRADLADRIFSVYLEDEPLVRYGWQVLQAEKAFVLTYNEHGDTIPFVVDLLARDPDGKIVAVDHKFMYNFITKSESELMPQLPKYVGAMRALGFQVDYGLYNMIRTRKDAREITDTLPVMLSNQRIQRTFEEFIETAQDIRARKLLPLEVQDSKAVRVANKMVCQSCSFADLCKAQLNGGNVALLLDREYRERKRRNFDEEEGVISG